LEIGSVEERLLAQCRLQTKLVIDLMVIHLDTKDEQCLSNSVNSWNPLQSKCYLATGSSIKKSKLIGGKSQFLSPRLFPCTDWVGVFRQPQSALTRVIALG
jgi:hypothetical protein